MDDHDLLIRIDERVGGLTRETAEIKIILVSNFKRVSNLEGQVKGIWWILGGGGILGSIVAGLLALVGRK